MRKKIEECSIAKGVVPVAVVKEQRKEFILNNESGCGITVIAIDKCVFKDSNVQRCDYVLTAIKTDNSIRNAYFVELKGNDLVKGIRQLLNSLTMLINEFPVITPKARLVGTKDVPGMRNTTEYRQLKKLLLQKGGDIKYATNRKLTETV